MINKMADIHFNALRAASVSFAKSDGNEPDVSSATQDAMNSFLSSPSFNTKQDAIESLLRQIMQGSSPVTDNHSMAG